MVENEPLPPHCPEAERGVLGCCLLDVGKVTVALKAGVSRRWFYDIRHAELFSVLSDMALNGGGDFIVTTLILRERGKLESIGGVDYLIQLQDSVPSAENLEDYRSLIPQFRARIKDEGFALIIVDPTYKLLGDADENSASDITGLLNAMENLAVSTGAAVAMAGHFAKGNAAAKETIDRISGSGVFARDPDSLITFTKHEQEGAFTVEMVLRNLPPVEPFVVEWAWPLFRRAEDLDPTRLKQAGGRPAKHKPETLLECLGDQRLTTTQWKKIASEEHGVSATRFFLLIKGLEEAGKVAKSVADGKWHQNQPYSRNWYDDKDQ